MTDLKHDLLKLADESGLAEFFLENRRATVMGYDVTDELLVFANSVLEYAIEKGIVVKGVKCE